MFDHLVDFSSPILITVFVGNLIRYLIEGYIACSNYMLLDAERMVDDLKASHPLAESEFDERMFYTLLSYNRIRAIFNYFMSSIFRILTVVFLITGIVPTMLHYMNQFDIDMPTKLSALIAVNIILSGLIGLPVELLSDRIEKKFGYSNMTVRLMLSDMVKSSCISVIINAAIIHILSYVLSLISRLSLYTVFVFVMVAFVIFWCISVVSAYFIMPMFNKFSSLENGVLKDKLVALAHKFNIKLKDVYVMDASRRSKKGNAFCLDIPFGPTKLVLFDTLLNELTTEEIVSVMGHEFAHKMRKHNLFHYATSLIGMFILGGVSVYLVYNPYFYHSFGFRCVTDENICEYTLVGLCLVVMFVRSVSWIITPFISGISRCMEYSADRISVMYTNDKESMITSLIKIHSRSGSTGISTYCFEFWFMSHPSLLHRVEAIKRLQV